MLNAIAVWHISPSHRAGEQHFSQHWWCRCQSTFCINSEYQSRCITLHCHEKGFKRSNWRRHATQCATDLRADQNG